MSGVLSKIPRTGDEMQSKFQSTSAASYPTLCLSATDENASPKLSFSEREILELHHCYLQQMVGRVKSLGIESVEVQHTPEEAANMKTKQLKAYTFAKKDGEKKVTNVIFSSTATKKTMNAFTTGSFDGADNFDTDALLGGITVEGCCFGAGKKLVEEYMIQQCLQGNPEAIGHFLKNEKSSSDKVTALRVALKDHEAWLSLLLVQEEEEEPTKVALKQAAFECLDEQLGPKYGEVDAQILKLALEKGITSEDPLVAFMQSPERKNTIATCEGGILAYMGLTRQLLPYMPIAKPLFAKAIGRLANWSLVCDIWEDKGLAPLVVEVTRRFLLSDPETAYVFGITHCHGGSNEISKFDNIWALQLKQKDSKLGPLCSFKSSTKYLGEDVSDLVEGTMGTRKLGLSNLEVAKYYMGIPPSEEHRQKQEWAAKVLVDIKWVDFMEEHVAKPINAIRKQQGSIMSPPPLPAELVALLRNTTFEMVEDVLETLKRSLAPAVVAC